MLRRKLGKKGLVASQTTLAMYAVAVLIVLFVVFKTATSVVHAQDIIEACHLSTILSSWQLQKDILVMNLDLMDSPFSLDCRTLFTEITKNGVNRALFPASFGEDDSPTQKKDKLKAAIMAEIDDCWYMYGKGITKVQQAVETKEGKTTCLVCSEIIPTQEFIDSVKDSPEDVLKLDNMYDYAATHKDPRRNKYYVDYLLEGTKARPNTKIPEPDNIVLFGKDKTGKTIPKRYSVVFAVADQAKGMGLFDRRDTIAPNVGIIGCNLGGYDKNPATNENAIAIGCGKNGRNDNGLIFGKVLDGGKHDELLSWRTVTPGFTYRELKRFPMTVRLVPTEEMLKGDFCNRLY